VVDARVVLKVDPESGMSVQPLDDHQWDVMLYGVAVTPGVVASAVRARPTPWSTALTLRPGVTYHWC
jgi:hypothetical protein